MHASLMHSQDVLVPLMRCANKNELHHQTGL